jgi:hypothetical protein
MARLVAAPRLYGKSKATAEPEREARVGRKQSRSRPGREKLRRKGAGCRSFTPFSVYNYTGITVCYAGLSDTGMMVAQRALLTVERPRRRAARRLPQVDARAACQSGHPDTGIL